MGIMGFPVVAGAQVTKTDTTAYHEPGTMMMVRDSDGLFGLVKYFRFEVAVNKGDALVWFDVDQNRVEIASLSDGLVNSRFRGIAAATVAASSYGWAYIHGNCPFARFSTLVASGDRLCLSGSTAGRLVQPFATVFNVTAGVATAGTQVLGVPFIALGAASNAATAGTACFITGVWG